MPPHSNQPPLTPKVLSFSPASMDKIAKLLHASPNKQCDLDPIATFLLKQVSYYYYYYYYLYCAVARRHEQFVKQGRIYNTIEEFCLVIR